jgi:EmrB/QacA subfamily drug resistance transporter
MSHIGKPPCDEGIIRSARPAPAGVAARKPSEPWILVATILGSGLAFIDGTVVNVALPAIQAQFGGTATQVQWVVESYGLFLASLLLVGGSLGDRFGRRRVFSIGVALFAGASLWCGLVTTMEQLIVARAVQGIGGALLVPGSLALIGASFDEATRGRAIGTWSGFSSITAAVGPVVGGWFVEHVSWRWAFFINLPIAVAVLVVVAWRVPESRDDWPPPGLDWIGAGLATVGLAGLVYGLIESSNRGWTDAAVLGALAIGAAGLVAFVVAEFRVRAPMMPPSLFRSTNFTAANVLTLFLYMALGGALFFFPFNLIQLQHYSPTAAGAALLPFVAIMFALSRWAGGLVQQYGPKPPLVVGPAIAAMSFILFTRPAIGGTYWTTFFPAVIALSLGMAITVAPLTTTVMGAVDQRHAGIASGINNAVSRTAGLLGVAIMGIVLASAFNRTLDRQLAALNLPLTIRQAVDDQRSKLAGTRIPDGLGDAEEQALRRAIDLSFVSGFRAVMWLAAVLAAVSAIGAWAMFDRTATLSQPGRRQSQ